MNTQFASFAFRLFTRNGLFSILSLGSLVVGTTTALVVVLWLRDELMFDRYHPDNDKVYQVMRKVALEDGSPFIGDTAPGPLADFITSSIPEVESATQMGFQTQLLLSTRSQNHYANGEFVDEKFTSIFNFPMVYDSDPSALKGTDAILLSKSLAQKLFPNERALGQVVTLNNNAQLTVKGVYELPANSSMHFDFLMPYQYHAEQELSTWDDSNSYLYIKVCPDADISAIEQKLTQKLHEVWKSNGTTVFLFKFTDWHLYWNSIVNLEPSSRAMYLFAFGVAGIFVLAMACINFINLTTARVAARAREVGVRKVTGATRSDLTRQFLSESFTLTFVAVVVSCLLTTVVLPVVNLILDKKMALDLTDPFIILVISGLIAITGLLAGWYPALVLSALKPATVLKGHLHYTMRGGMMRSGLMSVQFGLSVMLIFGSIIVYQQLAHMRNIHLGFDHNNVLYIETSYLDRQPTNSNGVNFETFKTEVQRNPHVIAVTQAAASPMEINGVGLMEWSLGNQRHQMNINNNPVDPNYLATLGFEFTAGRDFNGDLASDSSAIIITQTAADLLGFEQPIGSMVYVGEDYPMHIIGIVKDFQNADIHDATSPVFFYLGDESTFGRWRRYFIRYEPGSQQEVLAHVNAIWKNLNPATPPNFVFLDSDFERQFRLDDRIGVLSMCFTVIAILIASIGLFGLCLFNAERRTKEFGVRRVLGANTFDIVQRLGFEFLKPILISLAIALPCSYWVMSDYLSTYRHHTTIGARNFLVTVIVMSLVVVITVARQAIKASQRNPIDALKTE